MRTVSEKNKDLQLRLSEIRKHFKTCLHLRPIIATSHKRVAEAMKVKIRICPFFEAMLDTRIPVRRTLRRFGR